MKSKELRVGNLIFKNLSTIKCDSYSISSIENYDHLAKEYKPIELDENWLINFGFNSKVNPNKTPSFIWRIDDRFKIIQSFFGEFYYYPLDGNRIKINSIHQLQNLYFALTNEELEAHNPI